MLDLETTLSYIPARCRNARRVVEQLYRMGDFGCSARELAMKMFGKMGNADVRKVRSALSLARHKLAEVDAPYAVVTEDGISRLKSTPQRDIQGPTDLRTVSFLVSDSHIRTLDRVAEERGASRASVVREIIDEWHEEHRHSDLSSDRGPDHSAAVSS